MSLQENPDLSQLEALDPLQNCGPYSIPAIRPSSEDVLSEVDKDCGEQFLGACQSVGKNEVDDNTLVWQAFVRKLPREWLCGGSVALRQIPPLFLGNGLPEPAVHHYLRARPKVDSKLRL